MQECIALAYIRQVLWQEVQQKRRKYQVSIALSFNRGADPTPTILGVRSLTLVAGLFGWDLSQELYQLFKDARIAASEITCCS